tara:strand:- start:13613 stop:14239 length:627 start_codon:yes stop_codon:yes gene_type:complete
MSIECLNKALKIDGLTPTKKLVLVILANYADEKGTCYPSYKHIARVIGLETTRTIQNAIKEFEEMGLLRIERRKLDNGGYTSNRYHLTLKSDPIVADNTTPTTDSAPTQMSSRTNNTKDNTKEYTKEFEVFWKHYPRKVGKYQASVSFCKLDPKQFPMVIHAAKVFAQENLTTDEKFIPHAATFLNQQRYLDFAEKPIKNKNLNNLAG